MLIDRKESLIKKEEMYLTSQDYLKYIEQEYYKLIKIRKYVQA
jgi:hypothetical protein